MRPSLARRLFRNSVLNALRFFCALLVALGTSAVLARALGPALTGRYTLALWWATMLVAICHLGIPDALLRYLAELQGAAAFAEAAALHQRLLRVQLLAVAAVVSLAALTMWWMDIGSADFRWAFLLFIFTTGLMQSLSASLNGLQRYGWLLFAVAISGAVQLPSVLLAARFRPTPGGMLLALSVGTGVAALLCLVALRSTLPSAGATVDMSTTLLRVRGYSAAMWYIMLLDLVVWNRSEVVFLQLRSTSEQIAFYGLAFAFASRLDDLVSPVAGVLIPIFAEEHGRSGRDTVAKLYSAGLRLMPIFIVPLCVYLFVAADRVVLLLYGRGFAPVAPALRVLLAGVAVMSVSAAGHAAMAALEQQGFSARWGTAIAILNLALAFLLVPRLGAVGAAISNSVAQVSAVVVTLIFLHRMLKIGFPWSQVCSVWLAAIFSAIPLWTAIYFDWRWQFCALSATFGILLYWSALSMVGAMRELNLLVAAMIRREPIRTEITEDGAEC